MDVDEQLIEEVRNRTILFDLGHTNYKNLKKKELEWREVAAIVKLNGRINEFALMNVCTYYFF